MLSNQPMSEYIPTSPYKIWLAIVVVSAISYLSYIIKKFIFPESGILLSAVLGGMYSSTAVTVVLAKKSREGTGVVKTAAGIIFATGVMYVRILILPFIFNQAVAGVLLPYLLILGALAGLIGLFFLREKHSEKDPPLPDSDHNPLEFKVALIFGLLFTLFGILTKYILEYYGSLGMGILSFIVGVTDIDPYLLSLFQHGACPSFCQVRLPSMASPRTVPRHSTRPSLIL